MCTVTALLESDILPMNEPETVVVLDTAAGPVTANATCANGRVEKISLDMPPSFVTKLDAAVETPEFGKINYDLCFGGIFYALIDVEQVGLTIVPDNARKLATLGVKLHEQISAADPAVHPLTPELNGLSYVMFRSEEPDGAIRTCTTLIPGRVDRSPCGTGSNSNIAAQYARKKVTPGDIVISRSIIGGEFSTKFLGTTMVGPYEATSNRLTGKSWIYSTTEIRQDDSDPFPNGFTLSDTWGSSTK